MGLSLDNWLLVIGVGLFTAIASAWDLRTRRIPNAVTVPAFFAGLIWQGVFHGLSGLGDAGLGFLLGFGTLFVLWMIGGGGGGDVKLMGALSVWLGFKMTLWVMIVGTVFVILGTAGMMAKTIVTGGIGNYMRRMQANARAGDSAAPRGQRRIMAYALPVSLATWVVLAWQLVKM